MSDMVLVTGGTGFIGAAVTAALRGRCRDVIALGRTDGDIVSPETLDRHRGKGITSVIHCAGRTFVPDSWKDPAGFMATNAVGTLRALEFCRAEGARLVHISAYIYGQPEKLPIAEDAPVRANNPYAFSKYVAEQTCRFHAERLGVPVTILRPFNIYGPGQRNDFLIPTIIRQVRSGPAVQVKDLEPRRDYIFLDDLVAAILISLDRRNQGLEIVNLGSGTSHSIAELIELVQSVAGTRWPVVSEKTPRISEISDVCADISHAQNLLGWKPRVSMADGIKRLFRLHDTLPG